MAEYVASPDDHYREPDMTLAMAGDGNKNSFAEDVTLANLVRAETDHMIR